MVTPLVPLIPCAYHPRVALVRTRRDHPVPADIPERRCPVTLPPNLEDNQIWASIEKGVGQATIVVVDPEPVERSVRERFAADGAVEGEDYELKDVHEQTGLALVAGTPVAWLPEELARALGHSSTTFERFAPETIRARLGPRLSAAAIFSARAHATFDVAVIDQSLRSTRDAFRSPLARLILRELLATRRVFDREHVDSVNILNEASDEIADRLTGHLGLPEAARNEPLVREADSRAVNHLQAADIAAGWAREVIDNAGMRSLGDRFERVWVNGFLLKDVCS